MIAILVLTVIGIALAVLAPMMGADSRRYGEPRGNSAARL